MMARIFLNGLLIAFCLSSVNLVVAGSNNGYTTAANVYTGSSSRTWYGGGVAFVLAEWKKEKAMAESSPNPNDKAKESVVPPATEAPLQ